MALKIRPRAKGIITIDGEDHEIRSLTIEEVGSFDGLPSREVNIKSISWSFGMPLEDAEAWYESADAGTALAVLNGINEVSGLGKAAQFRRAEANDAGPTWPTEHD